MAVLKFTQVSFIGRNIRPVGVVAALSRHRVEPHRWFDPMSSSRSDSAVTGKYHSQYSRGA
jgi:hypothetical protein